MIDSKVLATMIKGEVKAFESHAVKMAGICSFIQEGTEKELTKGTEYRAAAHAALMTGGFITLGVTDEMKSKSVFGLFLKRLSDHVDNKLAEDKPEKEKAEYDALSRLNAIIKECKEHDDFARLLRAHFGA